MKKKLVFMPLIVAVVLTVAILAASGYLGDFTEQKALFSRIQRPFNQGAVLPRAGFRF